MMKKYYNFFLLIVLLISFFIIFCSVFIFNREKFNNYTQNIVYDQPYTTMVQSLQIQKHRQVKFITFESTIPLDINTSVSISHQQNKCVFSNLTKYQYNSTYRLPINIKITNSTPLVLTFKGVNLNKIILSTNVLLGQLSIDNKQFTNNSIKLQIEMSRILMQEQKIYLFIVGMILLLLYILCVLKYNEYTFFYTFVIILTFSTFFIQKESMLINPHYETLHNFGRYAFTQPISTMFFIPDAGYMPLMTRLITLILIKGLHLTQYYMPLVTIVSLLISTSFLSFFSLNSFRRLIKIDIIRSLVGISISFIHMQRTSLYEIFNIPYLGATLLFLGLIINVNRISRKLYIIFLILCPILILSKALLISFLPIYGLLFLYYCYTVIKARTFKNYQRQLLFFGNVSLGGFLQFLFMLGNMKYMLKQLSTTNTWTFPPHIIQSNFTKFYFPLVSDNIAIFLFITVILLYPSILYFRKREREKEMLKVIFYSFSMIMLLYITSYSYASMSPVIGDRRSIIGFICGTFATMFIFNNIFHNVLKKKIGLKTLQISFIILIVYSLTTVFITNYSHTYNENFGSRWSVYSSLVKEKSWVISEYVYWNPPIRRGVQYNTKQVTYQTNLSNVNSVIINRKNPLEQLKFIAYDKNAQELFTINDIDSKYANYAYFLFDQYHQQNFDHFKIFNQLNQEKFLETLIFINDF